MEHVSFLYIFFFLELSFFKCYEQVTVTVTGGVCVRFIKYSVLLSKMLQKREEGTKNWAGAGEGGVGKTWVKPL